MKSASPTKLAPQPDYRPRMRVVGIVSPGAMGSAVGAAYLDAGRRVVTTLAGRSERTCALAEAAGLEILPDLDAVVAEADLVLSIAPPDQALAIGADLALAATRTGPRPLVSDWNAISPATAHELERVLAAAGLELVDGSISGGPPRADYRTRIYLSGARAAELVGPPRLDVRVVGDEIGLASAVKMCTASVYKGFTALLAQALATAHSNGVLEPVLDDLHDSFPRQIDDAARLLAVSTTKASRYVGEMHEIAATQERAGSTPALFEAMAEVYARLARTELAAEAPEAISASPALEDVLVRMKPVDAGERT
jgi:3-hydroxyisobutyrate dehydrogenase-like beta-hydroxyacid dehydrogenase